MQAMTCAEPVMKLLSAYEVDTVFGMAGTMSLELYGGIALSTGANKWSRATDYRKRALQRRMHTGATTT